MVNRVTPYLFHIVEWHRPYYVLRQFGLMQCISEQCDTEPKLHKYDLRGQHDLYWITIHHYYIERWEARNNHLVRANASSTSFGYNHPYMMWYCTITHLFISPYGSSSEIVVIFVIICFHLLFYILHSF